MESKYSGYMGKIMEVDLTTETVREYPWSDEQRELYLGGKIMAPLPTSGWPSWQMSAASAAKTRPRRPTISCA